MLVRTLHHITKSVSEFPLSCGENPSRKKSVFFHFEKKTPKTTTLKHSTAETEGTSAVQLTCAVSEQRLYTGFAVLGFVRSFLFAA